MLTQDHVNVIKGFLGQTTGFKKDLIKTSVIIMAEKAGTDQVRYLHGNYGRGTFTFYGGHDPEDYQHAVGIRRRISRFTRTPRLPIDIEQHSLPCGTEEAAET